MLKGKIPSVWGFSYFNVRLKTIGQWSPSGSVYTLSLFVDSWLSLIRKLFDTLFVIEFTYQ